MMTMKHVADKLTLNNGYQIPCVGYGTYQTPPEEAYAVTKTALELGYRHVDTAAFYQNEEGVGQAIRESGIPREEIFVTTKVWNDDRGYDKTIASVRKSLATMGLDYIDLVLIHWPANYRQFGTEAAKINADTWRALEDLCHEGCVKAIGLSNFLAHHIEKLLETAEIKPQVDQIEFHPGWLQAGVVRYCQDNDILVQAWSPMGRSDALSNETIVSVAQKYGKSPTQLCIRWVMQHGVLPLPKSVTAERIRENMEVFDFEISEEDMKTLDNLDLIGGQCARPDDVDF